MTNLVELLIEAGVIILILGGLEVLLWYLDRKYQEEQLADLDSLLEELQELNDKTPDMTKREEW